MTPHLVLASASERRRDILDRLGLDFEVRVPGVDESTRPDETPEGAAVRLAAAKAWAAVPADGELIVAADTLVLSGNEILGKPAGRREAERMVARLSGGEHVVITGLALADAERVEVSAERTRVWFRSLDAAEGAEYVATGEPLDKAGAYGIQGYGAALVERIDGDFFNVMGLPVQRLLDLLRRFGWRYAFGSLVPLSSTELE
jgi:septum formation protein